MRGFVVVPVGGMQLARLGQRLEAPPALVPRLRQRWGTPAAVLGQLRWMASQTWPGRRHFPRAFGESCERGRGASGRAPRSRQWRPAPQPLARPVRFQRRISTSELAIALSPSKSTTARRRLVFSWRRLAIGPASPPFWVLEQPDQPARGAVGSSDPSASPAQEEHRNAKAWAGSPRRSLRKWFGVELLKPRGRSEGFGLREFHVGVGGRSPPGACAPPGAGFAGPPQQPGLAAGAMHHAWPLLSSISSSASTGAPRFQGCGAWGALAGHRPTRCCDLALSAGKQNEAGLANGFEIWRVMNGSCCAHGT